MHFQKRTRALSSPTAFILILVESQEGYIKDTSLHFRPDLLYYICNRYYIIQRGYMLDTNEILKEVDDLLDSNYTQLLEQKPGQVRVYEKPQRLPEPTQTPSTSVGPSLPATKQVPARKSNPVSELVVNTFVLLLLAALSDRLANQ